MKSCVITFCFSFFFLTAIALAAEKPPAVSVDVQTFAALVQPLLTNFLIFDGQAMSKLVADNFVPNKFDFLVKTQDSFYKVRPLTLEFVSGDVMTSQDKVIVKFRWQRTALEGVPGRMVKKAGSAEFVFVLKGEERLLYKIGGSSPFEN